MKIIKSSFTTLMFISLIINISTSYANQSREEQIQALTQNIHQKEDEIAAKSTQFITDLKEKYPHFNDEQLDSMRLTFEESLLNNIDYKPKHKKHKSDNTASEPEKTLSKEVRQGKVSQLVKNNREKEQREADKEIIKEADITVVSLTIKQGDTLGDIAQRAYGNSAMYIAIYEENKDQLSSPNQIPEGIVLRVPKIDSSMQNKFTKLIKETQQKTSKEKHKKTADTNVHIERNPEELNRLISEAVINSTRE